ncbi:MAG TPA: alkaline phosphatase PhoX [Burkholderiaceae bacterium]|nr:alkaline phosphatase PhoX [Burkholderiaceae bacterium]
MSQFDPSRRSLMIGGSAAVAAAFGGPITAMAKTAAYRGECRPGDASPSVASPYGPTAPVNDLTTGLPLVELPAGFRYLSYGWTGDAMSDGLATPAAHDGMGVVVQRRVGVGNEMVLVRNHERSTSTNMANIVGIDRTDVAKYDLGLTGSNYQIGGNTNLVFRNGQWVDSWASLGGIYRPCAGGSSLWGSWLSNEELRSNNVSTTGKKHGYVFEVPADTTQNAYTHLPIVDMGRMAHEASAIDPATGHWYLTEDQGDANTLYRFLPNNLSGGLGSLHAGGRLQGLAVRGQSNADLRFPQLCQKFQCTWVDIANPDLDGSTLAVAGVGSVSASGPYRQAYANGAAIFGANEGCWVADGVVYFSDKRVATSPARAGRIWALDLATMTLEAIFVSNDILIGNSPDNVCISPRGGVLFCEDGGNSGPKGDPAVTVEQMRLMGVTPQGASYVFAKHNFNFTAEQLAAAGKSTALAGDHRDTEWAGSVFSPDGHWLFVNLYTPGITLAITGPWARGTL